MRILVLAEHEQQTLKPATQAVVAAAVRIAASAKPDAEIDLLVVGQDCAAVAAAAAGIAGVSRVRCCDAPHYADLGAENLAALLAPLAAEYSHLLAPASALGKSVMPRLAGLLDVPQASEIIDVLAPDTFVRPIYAGSVLTTVRLPAGVKLATVRATAFEPAGAAATPAPVEALAAGPDLGLSRVLGRELNVSARPELTAASVVVAGGRGLASGENFHALLEPLADRLGAALGASRASVDAGYVSNDLQILKHQYWNEALTFLGVENVNTEKKERLVSDEVMSNMGDVEAQRFTRLNARKWACEQISDMFGLDVDCDFRSGMYIKADGYGAQNIATTGMQSGTAGVQGAGYAMDTSEQGVVAKIRAMLGM